MIARRILTAMIVFMAATWTHQQPGPMAAALVSVQTNSPLTAVVAMPRQPFLGTDNKLHLVYEIELTNNGDEIVVVNELQIFDSAKPFKSLTGLELTEAFVPYIWNSSLVGRALLETVPQVLPARDDPPKIGSRGTRRVFLWFSLPQAATVPPSLQHRLITSVGVIEIPTVHLNEEKPIVISPPLTGGIWLAAEGPSNWNHHRRGNQPGRLATDWIRVEDVPLWNNPKVQNTDYKSYGAEVIAVADGVVDATGNGVIENRPGSIDRSIESGTVMTMGNFVRLNLGENRYALYMHMQPGSVRVKPGEQVRRGQLLGLLGNSGNSSVGPHLHFDVVYRVAPGYNPSIPFVFDGFERVVDEQFIPMVERLPLKGDRVKWPAP